jgi:cysteine desulfurase family protein (TIGR01976 family)
MSASVGTAAASRVPPADEIREQFPALQRRQDGRRVAYFDGPGGTQVPRVVADAVTDYLLHHNANTHWAYPTSIETDAAIARARRTLADFMNARDDEIAFGQNMTSLTFHVSRGIGRRLGPGDEIVVTELDHHANIAPWRALGVERGVTVRTVRMDPAAGQLDWADLERAIGDRTRVVAIGAASNALGTITDVAQVTRLAHAVGALAYVDAVHYAPHNLLDVRAIGCDFLACSAYKFYGPHIGVLYGASERILELDIPKLEPSPDTAPERLETGTQSHEAIIGAMAAVDYLADLGRQLAGNKALDRRAALAEAYRQITLYERSLARQLLVGLRKLDAITIHGITDPDRLDERVATVSFTHARRTATELAKELGRQGIFAWHGNYYALNLTESLGLEPEGMLRVGLLHYNTPAEVDRLLAALSAF